MVACVSELDNEATEEGGLISWITFPFGIFTPSGLPGVTITYLRKRRHQVRHEEQAVRCLGQCSAGKPWVLPFMWMLLCYTPFMETVFPNDTVFPQQDNEPCCAAKIVKASFKENKESTVLTWPPNSAGLSPIKPLRDVLDEQVRSMEAPSWSSKDVLL